MAQHRFHPRQAGKIMIALITILGLLTSCQEAAVLPENTSTAPPPPRNQTQLPEQPRAEITFEAQILTSFLDDQQLYIEFLDEVTGLALNAARVQMEKKDERTYVLKMPVVIGSLIKYRYVRDQDPFGYEYTTLGQQVRYRMYQVDGPGVAHDTIGGWKTAPFKEKTGRIEGQVALEENKAPVINALVTAGGLQTMTASDGSFLLEGLPPGLHNLVISSLDGSFKPFQQGAVVAPDSTTPALVMVNPVKLVNVTFTVSPPEDSAAGLPIRMVGNLYSLGNMFADLDGGVNVAASRAPMLAVLEDGKYTIQLKLPAGLDLRYKYTLGDGFWNAERAATGELRLRQIIVPDKDTEIEDAIDSWNTHGRAPVTFTVTVPDNTPATDVISIQFNPYGWTEPIPMWPIGNKRWFYILYNPLGVISSASYRFCRNDQCGVADAAQSQGLTAAGEKFSPSAEPQNINAVVDSWAWLDAQTKPVVVPAQKIEPRADGFQAGVAFTTGYQPSWQPYLGAAFQNLAEINANTVALTPTWHVTHQTPPVFAVVTGQDPLWTDLAQMTNQAHQKGLDVVIYPRLQYSEAPESWWASAPRDEGWWQSWFDQYRKYVLYHADLAAQSGAKVFILGDETLQPALPDGTLRDGTPSGAPGITAERWENLIADLRARFTGKIAWYTSFSDKLSPVPDFAAKLDLLYVEVSGPLGNSDALSSDELIASVGQLIDANVLPLQEKLGQPVLLGLRFPSAGGAEDGCVQSEGECLSTQALDLPAAEYPDIQADFSAQANAYTAVLAVVNQRSWVAGFYAVGYYPPVLLRDMSTSVRGKPAADVLWYWYPRFLGRVSQ